MWSLSQGLESKASNLESHFDDSLERIPLRHCVAYETYAHAVFYDALFGAPMKGHQQSLREDFHSLLGLFQQLRCVHGPGYLFLNVDPKEEEVCYPLHTVTAGGTMFYTSP